MSNLGSMIGIYSALTAGYIGLKYRSLAKITALVKAIQ